MSQVLDTSIFHTQCGDYLSHSVSHSVWHTIRSRCSRELAKMKFRENWQVINVLRWFASRLTFYVHNHLMVTEKVERRKIWTFLIETLRPSQFLRKSFPSEPTTYHLGILATTLNAALSKAGCTTQKSAWGRRDMTVTGKWNIISISCQQSKWKHQKISATDSRCIEYRMLVLHQGSLYAVRIVMGYQTGSGDIAHSERSDRW